MIGQTLDTNGRWIANRLMDRGIVPIEHLTLPDDREAIAAAFSRLATRVDVIVCSGGLGPTADDLTRFALADATGDELVQDAEALAQIQAWFSSRGRPMNVLNRVQAMRPSRATFFDNEFGTAPGIHARLGNCDVFCLPGPPGELGPMFERCVVPLLRPDLARTVRVRVLHTIGLGESEVALRLERSARGDLMARGRMPLVGTTASKSVVSCRIRYEGPLGGSEADELIARDEAEIRSILGKAVFGEEDDTLATVLVRALRRRSQTLATVESCTGGMLASQITDVPGASDVYRSGWITYSDSTKMREVGVSPKLFKNGMNPGAPGAVSAEVATAMAEGGLREADADYALAITGIAGPTGGSADKPVGTVYIALCGKAVAPDVRRFGFLGDRSAIREWAARAALAILWLNVSEQREIKLLRQVT